ncbi:hypothetical protein CSV63_03045 [Sporosarcina sp. P34]|nr:hypothetical protein CSV63_03045 [Sporosarcina sp. P34]
MPYNPTKWVNTTYDADGEVLQKGTPYNAENMNKIENELEDVSTKKHTHPNKAVLDSVKVENVHTHANKTEIDQVDQSLIDSKHTHPNKATLDTIAPENVHSHTNKTALDNLTQPVIDNSHTHPNKAVLDKLKQSDLDAIMAHDITLTDHEQRLVDVVERITSLKIKAVQTIAERDALAIKENVIIHVVDASADPTVTSGWAQYLLQEGEWVKIAENESIDVVLAWADIVGKPAKFPPESHTHAPAQVGLGNVDNVKQASKTEFNAHDADETRHIKPAERTDWNSKANGTHTHGWGEITGKPATFNPSAHTHTEADIVGLDKYTRDQVDAKVNAKANAVHAHTEADITNLDKYTKAEVDAKLGGKSDTTHTHPQFAQVTNNTTRIESLESSSGQLHTHANKATLDKITYSGAKPTIDLVKIEELENHTHNYEDLTNKPTVPAKTSQLTNDSGYVKSNAGRIHVSYSDSDIPPLQPNDIVLRVI